MRDAGFQRDISDLSQVGLEVSEVDLRNPDAAEWLSGYDIVWVRGGNVFALRRVLADTGTDQVLTDLIRGDAIVYAGYRRRHRLRRLQRRGVCAGTRPDRIRRNR